MSRMLRLILAGALFLGDPSWTAARDILKDGPDIIDKDRVSDAVGQIAVRSFEAQKVPPLLAGVAEDWRKLKATKAWARYKADAELSKQAEALDTLLFGYLSPEEYAKAAASKEFQAYVKSRGILWDPGKAWGLKGQGAFVAEGEFAALDVLGENWKQFKLLKEPKPAEKPKAPDWQPPKGDSREEIAASLDSARASLEQALGQRDMKRVQELADRIFGEAGGGFVDDQKANAEVGAEVSRLLDLKDKIDKEVRAQEASVISMPRTPMPARPGTPPPAGAGEKGVPPESYAEIMVSFNAAFQELPVPMGFKFGSKQAAYFTVSRQLKRDRAEGTLELLDQIRRTPGAPVEHLDKLARGGEYLLDAAPARDAWKGLSQWQQEVDAFLAQSGAYSAREEKRRLESVERTRLAANEKDAAPEASDALREAQRELDDFYKRDASSVLRREQEKRGKTAEAARELALKSDAYARALVKASPESEDLIVRAFRKPDDVKKEELAALQKIAAVVLPTEAGREYLQAKDELIAAQTALGNFYKDNESLGRYRLTLEAGAAFHNRSIDEGIVPAGTEFSPAELGETELSLGFGKVIVDKEDGKLGRWRVHGLDPAKDRFTSLDGDLTIQKVKTDGPFGLVEDLKKIVLSPHVAEFRDGKDKLLYIEADARELFLLQRAAKGEHARVLARELLKPLARSGEEDAEPLAQWLWDSFGAQNGNTAGLRILISPDAAIQLVYQNGDGTTRVDAARFGPATAFGGKSAGEALVAYQPAVISKEGQALMGGGADAALRFREYLRDGSRLSWRDASEREDAGFFTGGREKIQTVLRLQRRDPDTLKWVAVGKEDIGKPRYDETGESSTLGFVLDVGKGSLHDIFTVGGRVTILEDALGGLGEIGSKGYHLVVAEGQYLVGTAADRELGRVDGVASMGRLLGWDQELRDAKDPKAREAVARKVFYLLDERMIGVVNERVYEIRKADLEKEGYVPPRVTITEYQARLFAGVSDLERAQVLLDPSNFGAGSFGARLGRMAEKTDGAASVALSVGSVAMYAGESTAQSLPTLIALGGLGRFAGQPLAAQATRFQTFAHVSARVTHTVLLSPYMSVSGALDTAEGFRAFMEAAQRGDRQKMLEAAGLAAGDFLDGLFSAKELAHGIVQWRAERARRRVADVLDGKPSGEDAPKGKQAADADGVADAPPRGNQELLADLVDIHDKNKNDVVGIVGSEAIPLQKHPMDCAIQAVRNNPNMPRVLRLWDYENLLALAEKIVGTSLRKEGTNMAFELPLILDAFGMEARGVLDQAPTTDAVVAQLKRDGSIIGVIDSPGVGPHQVLVSGAVKRDGVWKFLVTDSNYETIQEYSAKELFGDRKLKTMEIGPKRVDDGRGGLRELTEPEQIAAAAQAWARHFDGPPDVPRRTSRTDGGPKVGGRASDPVDLEGSGWKVLGEGGQGVAYRSQDGKSVIKTFERMEGSTGRLARDEVDFVRSLFEDARKAGAPVPEVELVPTSKGWALKMDFIEGRGLDRLADEADYSDTPLDPKLADQASKAIGAARRGTGGLEDLGGGGLFEDGDGYPNLIARPDGSVVYFDPVNAGRAVLLYRRLRELGYSPDEVKAAASRLADLAAKRPEGARGRLAGLAAALEAGGTRGSLDAAFAEIEAAAGAIDKNIRKAAELAETAKSDDRKRDYRDLAARFSALDPALLVGLFQREKVRGYQGQLNDYLKLWMEGARDLPLDPARFSDTLARLESAPGGRPLTEPLLKLLRDHQSRGGNLRGHGTALLIALDEIADAGSKVDPAVVFGRHLEGYRGSAIVPVRTIISDLLKNAPSPDPLGAAVAGGAKSRKSMIAFVDQQTGRVIAVGDAADPAFASRRRPAEAAAVNFVVEPGKPPRVSTVEGGMSEAAFEAFERALFEPRVGGQARSGTFSAVPKASELRAWAASKGYALKPGDGPETWIDPKTGEWRLKLKEPSEREGLHDESKRPRYSARTDDGRYFDPATGRIAPRSEVGHQSLDFDQPRPGSAAARASFGALSSRVKQQGFKLEDAVKRSVVGGSPLGTGGSASVYKIPGLDGYVAKVPRGEISRIKEGQGLGPLEEVPDRLPEVNIGQAVAKMGRVLILKEQRGVPGPFVREGINPENYQAQLKVFRAHLERVAGLPPSAFRELASSLKKLHSAGYSFDPSNPSNLLIDAQDRHINIVDVDPSDGSDPAPAVSDLTVSLLTDSMAAAFKDEPGVAELSRAITAKCLEAGRAEGLKNDIEAPR